MPPRTGARCAFISKTLNNQLTLWKFPAEDNFGGAAHCTVTGTPCYYHLWSLSLWPTVPMSTCSICGSPPLGWPPTTVLSARIPIDRPAFPSDLPAKYHLSETSASLFSHFWELNWKSTAVRLHDGSDPIDLSPKRGYHISKWAAMFTSKLSLNFHVLMLRVSLILSHCSCMLKPTTSSFLTRFHRILYFRKWLLWGLCH